MPLNPYFNVHTQTNEQTLVEDLIYESIRMYGYDVQYIPRILNDADPIFNEDASSVYKGAYPIAMYIRNVDGFSGDGTFLQKFGIEIRSQVTFSVSIRDFTQSVSTPTSHTRPLEGSLIYLAMDNKLFQIKKVDKYSVFYQTGALQTYDLICEVFEYAGEKLQTGIAAVDEIANSLSFSSVNITLIDSDGNTIVDENRRPILTYEIDDDLDLYDQVSSADEIRTDSAALIDLSENDPLSETF